METIYCMCSIAHINIQNAVHGNANIKQLVNVPQSLVNHCICQDKYAGICLVALVRKQTDSSCRETE